VFCQILLRAVERGDRGALIKIIYLQLLIVEKNVPSKTRIAAS
jgi:hypothetical protein